MVPVDFFMSVLFVCFCNASGCVANRQTEWFWWSLRPLGAQCVAWELVFGALYYEVIGGHRTAGNSDINYLCNVFVYWLLNLRNIWSNSVSQFFFRLFSQLVLCKWAITWCPIEIIYDFCLNVSKQLRVLFFLHFFPSRELCQKFRNLARHVIILHSVPSASRHRFIFWSFLACFILFSCTRLLNLQAVTGKSICIICLLQHAKRRRERPTAQCRECPCRPCSCSWP